MKFAPIVLLASCIPVAGDSPHPVENVIELLKSLKQQVKEQGQAEEVTYSKFAKWCTDSKKMLSKAVKSSEDSIEALKPQIEGLAQENETLTTGIAVLVEEIANHTQANTDADTKRAAENTLYGQADGDFASTIQAFTEVITALQDAKTNSAALVQNLVSELPLAALGHLSRHQVVLLSNLTQNNTDPDPTSRPDLLAKGDWKNHEKKYTFRSDNVIDLLKDLKAAFEDQRVEATKAETNAVNAHELAADARQKAITAAESTRDAKQRRKTDCEQELNDAKSSLSDAEGDLDADTTTLGATKKQCTMKQSEWEKRMETRANEQIALSEGIKILAKVAGVRTEKPQNPVLPTAPEAPGSDASPTVLLQLQPEVRAVNLLRTEAKKLHSRSLRRFAEELESKMAGPFSEVNDMIQKMIFRLMAEQKDEDDHKNWCDLELSKTTASKENKEQALIELGLKLTTAKASVGEVSQAIVDSNKMITQISEFMEEATEVRNIGKQENEAAIKDAKAASNALAKAIAVLQAFYKDSGMLSKEAWELLQKHTAPVTLPANPATWESPYVGLADPTKPDGIIAVLEKIASDFSTMEAETNAQEATDEMNYRNEMKTQEIEKARRTKEVEMKTQEKQRLTDRIVAMEKTKKHTKGEKEAMEQYLKDLEPACVEGDSTYDERKKARSDEIDALKEAQVILADAFKTGDASKAGGAFLAQIHPSRRR